MPSNMEVKKAKKIAKKDASTIKTTACQNPKSYQYDVKNKKPKSAAIVPDSPAKKTYFCGLPYTSCEYPLTSIWFYKRV